MTPEQPLLEAASHHQFESLTAAQKERLQQAVAKVVSIAARKGITIEATIELLRSGLTVSELLTYLATQTGNVICPWAYRGRLLNGF